MLSMMQIFTTVEQKRNYRVFSKLYVETKVCEHTNTQCKLCTNALTLLKLLRRDLESPQGSVIYHSSVYTYAYRGTKDVRYRRYVQWKFTGIPNPTCGNGSDGQSRNPYLRGDNEIQNKGGKQV
eukprot:4039965-Ditylum_brightwellii.AAC.1